jgi:ABC-type glycerol-3-phosphate transport system substrate-binding protein
MKRKLYPLCPGLVFSLLTLFLSVQAAAQDDWRNTPQYAPYPETLTVRVVKGGQESANLLPEGESIEDNRALKYIEDTLNIDIVYDWISPSGASYEDKLNLTISSGQIPDIMVVNPLQLQQLTEADAIEDMTPYIQEYANKELLAAYEKTNGIALEAATINGKIMGIPNVQPQADAPIMVWVRKDWLDKLGLEGPQTVDDLEAIAKAFMEQDPDGRVICTALMPSLMPTVPSLKSSTAMKRVKSFTVRCNLKRKKPWLALQSGIETALLTRNSPRRRRRNPMNLSWADKQASC